MFRKQYPTYIQTFRRNILVSLGMEVCRKVLPRFILKLSLISNNSFIDSRAWWKTAILCILSVIIYRLGWNWSNCSYFWQRHGCGKRRMFCLLHSSWKKKLQRFALHCVKHIINLFNVFPMSPVSCYKHPCHLTGCCYISTFVFLLPEFNYWRNTAVERHMLFESNGLCMTV